LYSIATNLGLKHEDVHARIRTEYGKSSSKELTIYEYNHLVEGLLLDLEGQEHEKKNQEAAAPIIVVKEPELKEGDFGYVDPRMVK
jgi:hypothetical protein